MTVLRILAEASWPDPDAREPEPLPPLPGFAASSFNPLVAETAERCLRARHGAAPAPGRTALLLASSGGDRATARAIDEAAADTGRRMPPLLFFQSNPNAVLGHIAARWGLTGPVVAISPAQAPPPGRVPQDALDLAELLLTDGDADQVLVIAAEQADSTGSTGSTDGTDDADGPHGTDRAVALLVTAV